MRKPSKPKSRAPKKHQISLARKSTALTIAGSDPSGGAGLQADVKAFQQNGVFATSAVTLLTVQNTQSVEHVEVMPVDLVRRQIQAVLDDIPPLVVKTGALGNPEMVAMVAQMLKDFDGPLVVDPVLVSKHGDRLAGDDMIDAYREHLFPIATMITPNQFEASALVGRQLEQDIDSIAVACRELMGTGPRFVLVKAGKVGAVRLHVLTDDETASEIQVADVPGDHGHGAGCCLSATIAAQLALLAPQSPEKDRIQHAVHFAISAVHAGLSLSPPLGKGCRPIEHRVLHLGNKP